MKNIVTGFAVGVVAAAGLFGVAGTRVESVGEGSATAQPASPPGVQTPANAGPADAVAKLAFLAGTWSGDMNGDPVEETWSAPMGDSIIGMFRWQSKGKTTLWETLSIKDESGTATLRLRHFDSKFEPWKGECEAIAALGATTVEPSKVVFTNVSAVGGIKACEYEVKEGALHITVSFKDDKRDTLRFRLTKAKGK